MLWTSMYESLLIDYFSAPVITVADVLRTLNVSPANILVRRAEREVNLKPSDEKLEQKGELEKPDAKEENGEPH